MKSIEQSFADMLAFVKAGERFLAQKYPDYKPNREYSPEMQELIDQTSSGPTGKEIKNHIIEMQNKIRESQDAQEELRPARCPLNNQIFKPNNNMATLKADKEQVLGIHRTGSPEVKRAFETVFINVFPFEAMAEGVTFEDYCNHLGKDPRDYDDSRMSNPIDIMLINLRKIAEIIAPVLNGDWKPNWNNDSEKKWYPWFYMGSGFRFRCADCVCTYSRGGGGSHLVFKDDTRAVFAGKNFASIYEKTLGNTR